MGHGSHNNHPLHSRHSPYLWKVATPIAVIGENMKKLTLVLIAILLVAAGVSAFAADRRVTFSTPTVVNGQKLAPGDYVLRYDVKGKVVDIKVLKNNKEVATIKGQVVETKEIPVYDAVVRVSNPDGSGTISEIQTANKKDVIRVEAETAVGK
jgi:hypothetical protein